MANKKNTAKAADNNKEKVIDRKGWWWCMSHAPSIEEDTHWFQMLPIILFGAITILLVRMYSYTRPMSQFYWSGGNEQLSDFFSHCKMVCIMICAVLALLFISYRFCTQSFAIKKSFVYIPMAVYAVFVLISYCLSEYKDFALWGYNDRFEGTMSLLAYMLMLFMVINFVTTEKNVKWILYPIFGSAALLGILGLSQGLDHDFFRTRLGQKLITQNAVTEGGQTVDQLIDQYADNGQQLLSFTFQNKEIYQTVYNINYVSFYLTLLIPVVGLLFIRSVERWKEDAKWKPFVWGALFTLLLYNIIGSASSGGYFGMFIAVVLAFIVLNKKIIRWWKPVILLLIITGIIGGLTYDRWSAELGIAVQAADLSADTVAEETAAEHHMDYLDTDGFTVHIGMDGTVIDLIAPQDGGGVYFTDANGTKLEVTPTEGAGEYIFEDPSLENCKFTFARGENDETYVIFSHNNNEQLWTFALTTDGIYYVNGFGTMVDLDPIPAIGFENNGSFGSGRGYIWSRTFPMMKDTLLVGHGADTYCLYFPHNDYVGKYNSGTFTAVTDIIVDKPHDMYMGAWVGTGGISILALLVMFCYYIIQSIRIYIRKDFRDMSFLDITGIGLGLGITAFLATGLFDDSTVSVMPMFYTLLGLGIAINMIQLRQAKSEN